MASNIGARSDLYSVVAARAAAGFFVLLLPFFNPDGEWSSLAQPEVFLASRPDCCCFLVMKGSLTPQYKRHKVFYLPCAVAIEASKLISAVSF